MMNFDTFKKYENLHQIDQKYFLKIMVIKKLPRDVLIIYNLMSLANLLEKYQNTPHESPLVRDRANSLQNAELAGSSLKFQTPPKASEKTVDLHTSGIQTKSSLVTSKTKSNPLTLTSKPRLVDHSPEFFELFEHSSYQFSDEEELE